MVVAPVTGSVAVLTGAEDCDAEEIDAGIGAGGFCPALFFALPYLIKNLLSAPEPLHADPGAFDPALRNSVLFPTKFLAFC